MGVLFDVINGDVDALVDALYALAPDEFVAARNDAAKSLKKAKRADDSALISKLAKPTAAAAALNRLARERPDLIETLLRAGARLHAVQDQLLKGAADVAAIRLASDDRRAGTRAIISALIELLEADDARRTDEWTRTLDAASTDDALGEVLRRGRFAKLALDGVGFDGSVLAAPTKSTTAATDARIPASRDRADTVADTLGAETAAPTTADAVTAEAIAVSAREAAAVRASEDSRAAAQQVAAEGEAARARGSLADAQARAAEAARSYDAAAAEVCAAEESLALARAALDQAHARRALAKRAKAEIDASAKHAARALDDAERAALAVAHDNER